MTRERAPDRSPPIGVEGRRGQACRVCCCTERNACMTDDRPCFWLDHPHTDLCSGCAAAAAHIVSMTIDWHGSTPEDVATCPCGWTHRTPRTEIAPWRRNMAEVAAMDAAIQAHWQAVVAEGAR